MEAGWPVQTDAARVAAKEEVAEMLGREAGSHVP